jgi:hypothetical protein
MADPFHRPQPGALEPEGDDEVAGAQLLDRHFPARGHDARAGDEAGRRHGLERLVVGYPLDVGGHEVGPVVAAGIEVRIRDDPAAGGRGPAVAAGPAVEDDRVAARAAEDLVVAGLGVEEVVAATADQRVVAEAAIKLVMAFAAVEPVLAFVARQEILPAEALQDVVAEAAIDEPVAVAVEDIVALGADIAVVAFGRQVARPRSAGMIVPGAGHRAGLRVMNRAGAAWPALIN